MLDAKAFDNDFHRVVTKNDNDMVLKNLKLLLEKNKLYEISKIIVYKARFTN